MGRLCIAAGAALLIPLAAGAQEPYRVGETVELHISGSLWQRCVVTENDPQGLMRGQCEEFVEPPPGTYRLVVGMYDSQTFASINEAGPIDLGEVVVTAP